MKKQTAIEWLIEQVKSPIWQDMFIWHKEEVFTQAKAMEKEQMIKFCQTWEDGTIEDTKTDLYNSIYGGDK